MQSVSSRIWTRVAVSISYDANHYTTGTSKTPRAPPRHHGHLHESHNQPFCLILRKHPQDTPLQQEQKAQEESPQNCIIKP